MTTRTAVTIASLSACEPQARDAFVRRFVEFVPDARDASLEQRVQYAGFVVSIALGRRSDLLLALDGGRVVGRALVAQSFAEPGAFALGLYAVTPGEHTHETGTALISAARNWAASHAGATLYAQGAETHIPAPSVDEVDPTGAGDVFAASFLAQLHRTGEPLLAAQLAAQIAAHSVTRSGLAGIPTRDELFDLLAEAA